MRMDCYISRRSVYCPNALTLGFAKRNAEYGDLIAYKTHFKDGSYKTTLGRMMGRVNAPAIPAGPGYEGSKRILGWLVVMTLANGGWHVYERWIDPKDVIEVHAYEHTALDVFAMRELPPIGALRPYLDGITPKDGLFPGKSEK